MQAFRQVLVYGCLGCLVTYGRQFSRQFLNPRPAGGGALVKKSCRTAEESPSVLQDPVGLYGTLVTDSGGSVGFLQDYLWDLPVLWDSCGTICAEFRVLWDSYRNICV